MTDFDTAWTELSEAPIGTLFTAGTDSLIKRDDIWYRDSDDAFFTSADLADFHGHSGYSLLVPTPPDARLSEETE